MEYIRGQLVEVVDFQGHKHKRVVYEDLGTRISITSQKNLEAINSGSTEIQPIAVPRSTVRGLLRPLK